MPNVDAAREMFPADSFNAEIIISFSRDLNASLNLGVVALLLVVD